MGSSEGYRVCRRDGILAAGTVPRDGTRKVYGTVVTCRDQ